MFLPQIRDHILKPYKKEGVQYFYFVKIAPRGGGNFQHLSVQLTKVIEENWLRNKKTF
jgi:hypothetical protein